jgi:hypothetical protein
MSEACGYFCFLHDIIRNSPLTARRPIARPELVQIGFGQKDAV